MKNRLTAVLLLLFIFSASEGFSQTINESNCVKISCQSQIDSLKQLLSSRGFSLLKEASMTMESAYEIPVVFKLNEGSRYHFVFIGEPGSLEYGISLFDWKENMVFLKKSKRPEADGNIIDYSFASQASEYHVFRPLQVNSTKPKGLCGYVLLFKKVS